MDDILESQYTYINQLDPEFKESLRLYTSEKLQYYRAINGYLRGDILYINPGGRGNRQPAGSLGRPE